MVSPNKQLISQAFFKYSEVIWFLRTELMI